MFHHLAHRHDLHRCWCSYNPTHPQCGDGTTRHRKHGWESLVQEDTAAGEAAARNNLHPSVMQVANWQDGRDEDQFERCVHCPTIRAIFALDLFP